MTAEELRDTADALAAARRHAARLVRYWDEKVATSRTDGPAGHAIGAGVELARITSAELAVHAELRRRRQFRHLREELSGRAAVRRGPSWADMLVQRIRGARP